MCVFVYCETAKGSTGTLHTLNTGTLHTLNTGTLHTLNTGTLHTLSLLSLLSLHISTFAVGNPSAARISFLCLFCKSARRNVHVFLSSSDGEAAIFSCTKGTRSAWLSD